MSSPDKPVVDLVSYLIKYGRARDFNAKQPHPRKGMLMLNTADGKIYFGSADEKSWNVYSSPCERIIYFKDPVVLKAEVEAKKSANKIDAPETEKRTDEDAVAGDDIEKKTRLMVQRELARREAAKANAQSS